MEKMFTRPLKDYKREVSPLKDYFYQMSNALHLQTGDSIEECRDFLSSKMKNQGFTDMKDPVVNYLERDIETEDRKETSTTLSKYIKSIETEDIMVAPTGTCYLKPNVKKSHYVGFLQDNVDKRKIFKKKSFIAKANGEMDVFIDNNNKQQVCKRSNNSLSGSFALKFLMTYNKTGHSTLTSTTRTITSVGNATAEKLNGNRHYFSLDIILNDIISITTEYDRISFKKFMEDNSLHYCTTEETMVLIKHCSSPYIKSNLLMKKIESLVSKLNPLDRSYFMYASDLRTLRVYNEDYIRTMIGKLSSKVKGHLDNPIEKIKDIHGPIMNLAHHICSDEIIGLGTDYEKMDKEGVLNTLVSTAYNIYDTLIEYKDFINNIFVHDSIPSSIANIRDMIRDTVVLSDTDSSCFSVDDWVLWWFNGEMRFDREAVSVAAVIAMFITESTDHMIKNISSNMNIDSDKLHNLSMKSEWYWPVFVRSNVAKHYFALASVNEGNVLEEPEMELKGVHLIANTSSKEVRDKAHDMMKDICYSEIENKEIDLDKYIREVAAVERSIIERIDNHDISVFKSGKVKDIDAYKDPLRSPYHHHEIWNAVFAEKYGEISTPPYTTIKLNTTIAKASDLKKWLSEMEDQELAERLKNYLVSKGKPTVGVMQLNRDFVLGNGIPKEILPIIDKRKIAMDNGGIFYVILETLGFYRKKNKLLIEMGY